MVFDGTPGEGLIAHSDSNWAVDLSNCCSITGYFFKLASFMVSWLSRAQKTVALSSTEAEYMAISNCCCQAMWIINLFAEIGFHVMPITICGDNQESLFISSNPVQERVKFEKFHEHLDLTFGPMKKCLTGT